MSHLFILNKQYRIIIDAKQHVVFPGGDDEREPTRNDVLEGIKILDENDEEILLNDYFKSILWESLLAILKQ